MKKALRKQVLQELKSLSAEEKEVMDAWLTEQLLLHPFYKEAKTIATYLSFPHEFQMDAKDCGPASLMIIAKFYGKYYSLQYLRDLCGITREGVSFLDISYAADKIGLRTVSVKASMHDIVDRISLPCIIHWNANHFIVVYKASKTKIYVSDPAKGLVSYSHEEL